LQALEESVIGHEGSGLDCTPRAKSDIYDCLVVIVIVNLLLNNNNGMVVRKCSKLINLYEQSDSLYNVKVVDDCHNRNKKFILVQAYLYIAKQLNTTGRKVRTF